MVSVLFSEMVGFGTGRDVARESHPHCENLAPVSEEKMLLSEGIVRSQAGTNRFATQKGMTGAISKWQKD